MTYKDIIELGYSFNHCFNELVYELKQKGMNSSTYASINEKYRSLSAQICEQLDLISIDEQPLKD